MRFKIGVNLNTMLLGLLFVMGIGFAVKYSPSSTNFGYGEITGLSTQDDNHVLSCKNVCGKGPFIDGDSNICSCELNCVSQNNCCGSNTNYRLDCRDYFDSLLNN